MEHDTESVANSICTWLGFNNDSIASAGSVVAMTMSDLSYSIERTGVLVLQTQRISIREMRGFSITERPYPVIVVNGSDALPANRFTLAHELTHVLLGSSAMCDLQDSRIHAQSSVAATERFCNRVSAAVLMPNKLILNHPLVTEASSYSKWDPMDLQRLASQFRVSEESMLIRLVSLGRANEEFYWSWRLKHQERYKPIVSELEDDDDEKHEDRKSRGPTYYPMKIRDYGRVFVQGVIAAYRRSEITAADVTSFLDVKFENLAKLEATAEG